MLTVKERKVRCKFRDLNIGDIFKYDGSTHLKIVTNTGCNALNFGMYNLVTIPIDAIVIMGRGTIEIEVFE